jgi:hypothetical protein
MKTLAKILTLFESWLAKPLAPWCIVLLVGLLLAPSLRTGWSTDDHVHRAAFRHAPIALGNAPADLFDFASGREDDAARLRADGVFPWWADSSARLHFFRPLASLTHTADHALWPENAVAQHAQSLAWYLLLVGVAWLVLRRTGGPRWIAVFALLLFALDDTHGSAVGWIASRNTLLCAIAGFLALWAHDRWRRDGWRAGAALGPLAFAVAMGCGEAGVATLGYLVAYALFLDRGRWIERAQRVLPYLVIVAAFAAIYVVGAYGAKHSTQYIDPAGEPGRYLVAVVVRLPVMLHALLAGPPSEFWVGYPVVNPSLPYIMWTFAVACVGVFLWVAWPVLKAERETRFWLLGAVLAALPACAGMPSNRALLFASLGIMVVVARFVVAVSRQADTLYPGKLRRSLATVNAIWIFTSSVPLTLYTLGLTARGNADLQASFARAAASLPHDPALAGKTLVVVDAAIEPILFYDAYERAARGEVRPARTRLLATSGGRALTVERLDERTLRLSAERGLLDRHSDMALRMRSQAGDVVDVPGMHVEVERVGEGGIPSTVRFRFDVPLEDAQLVWQHWDHGHFVPFVPPAVGQQVILPAVDMTKAFQPS